MNDARPNILRVAIYAAALTLLTLWVWGYYPAGGDAPIHLVFIYHYLDPTLFPGDSFIAALSHYHSFFWRGVATISSIVPPLLTVLFFHLFATWLQFIAIILLAQQLYGKTAVSVISSVFLIVFNFIPWGGALILSQQLDHGVLTRALLLLALWCFLRQKIIIAFLLLGMSFNIHPVMGFFMAAIFLFLIFSLPKQKIKEYLFGIGIALLVALPMIYRILSQLPLATLSQADRQVWLKLARIRLWWHLFPFLWSKKVLALYIFLFLLWLVSLRLFPPRDRRSLISILLISAAVFAMCIVGLLGSELFPQAFILKLLLFRSLKYWAILVFLGCGNMVYRLCVSLKTDVAYRIALLAMLLACLLLGILRLIGRNPFVSPPFSEDWKKICVWVKDRLPRDAEVLTPPHLAGFRVLSLHSTFVEWKDGGTLPWADKWTVETWWQRILYLSPQIDAVSPRLVAATLKEDYLNITAQKTAQTGASYFVALKDFPELTLVTSEGEFRLYQLKTR
jgi:hypothetical protein